MKSSKPLLILLLAGTTVGGAVVAWRQYAELVELRAAAMSRDEREFLHKRVAELEKQNRELQDRLLAARVSGDDLADMLDTDDATERPAGDRPRGERGERGPRAAGRGDNRGREAAQQQASAIRELLSKPEVQAMMSLQQKAAIEARYAALFKNLNLTPAQSEKLTALLAERGNTRRDVEEAARAQGINPRENPEAFRKLYADAQNELNNSIKSVIGESGFSQLQSYEQTIPQRTLVNQLQQRLSHSDTPLTGAQAEQLVQILAANSPPRPATPGMTSPTAPGGMNNGASMLPGGRGGDLGGRGLPGRGGMDGPGRGLMGAVVTPGAVAQAQTVLSPPQLNALQQIQRQQQTQQQLQQMIRDTLAASQAQRGGAASGGTAPANGSAPAPAPSGKRRGGG